MARRVEHALAVRELESPREGEGDYRFLCTADVEGFRALGTRFLQMPLALVHAARKGGAVRAGLRMRARLGRKAMGIGQFRAMEVEAVHPAAFRFSTVSYCLRNACRARVSRVMIAPSLVPSRAAISAQL